MKKIALSIIIPFIFGVPLLAQAQTSTPDMIQQQKQVAGYYQYQAGNVQITALLDGTNFMSPTVYKGISQQQLQDVLKKYYANQEKGIQTSVNAFLVNTGKSLVLVDSGASSCFGAHLGSILQNMVAAGYKPEQVDTILLTHLHPDHVCGVSKDSKANFPNATLYVSKNEANYWLDPKQVNQIPEARRTRFLETVTKIKNAIAPYQAAQRFKTYQLGDQIQGFQVISTPGHTPGHFSYELKTNNEDIVFIGDIVHSHTVQFDHPETAIEYDIDAKQAVQTRLKQFSTFAKQGQTIAAAHLPFPGIGHIYSQNGKNYQWIPIYFKD